MFDQINAALMSVKLLSKNAIKLKIIINQAQMFEQ